MPDTLDIPDIPDTRITQIEGRKLTPQQQDKLYSPQGFTFTYRKNGYERTVCFRPFTHENGPDILTHELSERKISNNPVIFGVQLTEEHVRQIRDGQYVYLENMKRNGRNRLARALSRDGRPAKTRVGVQASL